MTETKIVERAHRKGGDARDVGAWGEYYFDNNIDVNYAGVCLVGTCVRVCISCRRVVVLYDSRAFLVCRWKNILSDDCYYLGPFKACLQVDFWDCLENPRKGSFFGTSLKNTKRLIEPRKMRDSGIALAARHSSE